MNGKGSKKRPTNLKKFLKNWDSIDWKINPKVTEEDMIDAIDKHSQKSKEQFSKLPTSVKRKSIETLIKKTQHVAD